MQQLAPVQVLEKRDIIPVVYEPPSGDFVDVIAAGKLAFRFDPERGLIEWQNRGEKHLIDLSEYARA